MLKTTGVWCYDTRSMPLYIHISFEYYVCWLLIYNNKKSGNLNITTVFVEISYAWYPMKNIHLELFFVFWLKTLSGDLNQKHSANLESNVMLGEAESMKPKPKCKVVQS